MGDAVSGVLAAMQIDAARAAGSVRLSVGRQSMSDAVQALCFVAGVNSIFYGDKLLTTPNPQGNDDLALLARLGLKAGQPVARP